MVALKTDMTGLEPKKKKQGDPLLFLFSISKSLFTGHFATNTTQSKQADADEE